MDSPPISRRGFVVGALLCLPGHAAAMPEDLLKGKLIVSTESLPTKWTSAWPVRFAAKSLLQKLGHLR